MALVCTNFAEYTRRLIKRLTGGGLTEDGKVLDSSHGHPDALLTANPPPHSLVKTRPRENYTRHMR